MNIAEKVKPSTDLAIVETLKAEVVFAPGGVDAILEKIRAEVQSVKTDISTSAGRDQIRSLAFKVSRSKTALDELGKNLVADLKKQTGAIDAERRRIRDDLEALRDQVRQPLTAWEDAEKARVDDHEAALATLQMLANFSEPEPSLARINDRISALEAMPARDWQEFAKRATETRAAIALSLMSMRGAAEMREAERAELQRLRREQAEREQRERDARIAADAAERARTEAEAKALQEAEEAAARAEAERKRIEREKADAVARAEQAERDRITSEERAEAARIAAADAAERRRLQAIEDERKRVADAAAKEAAETARREANRRHCARINNEILADLLGAGVEEAAAKIAIAAIAQGKIRHTKVTY